MDALSLAQQIVAVVEPYQSRAPERVALAFTIAQALLRDRNVQIEPRKQGHRSLPPAEAPPASETSAVT